MVSFVITRTDPYSEKRYAPREIPKRSMCGNYYLLGRKHHSAARVYQHLTCMHAPMTIEQQRGVLFTESKAQSKRSNVAREMKNDHYTYTGYRIDPATGHTSWSPFGGGLRRALQGERSDNGGKNARV